VLDLNDWQARALKCASCIGLLLYSALPGWALAVEIDGNYHRLNSEFEYLVDETGELEFSQLLAEPQRYPFSDAAVRKPDAGFAPIWLKLQLRFSEGAMGNNYRLLSTVTNIYDLRVYRPRQDGSYYEWITGNFYPAATSELDSPVYAFRIEPTAAEMTLYMRLVGGPGSNKFPWLLVDERTVQANTPRHVIFNLVCLTAIATLFLFNLSLAASLRRVEYAFYSVFVFSVLMALVTLDGLGFYYLWPNSPSLNERALHSFNLLSAAARLMTVAAFLGIARVSPRLCRVTKAVLVFLVAGLAAVVVFGVTGLPAYTATYIWAIGVLMGYVVCIQGIRLKVRLAVPLLVALLLPTIGAIFQAVMTVNHFGDPAIARQLAKLGFVLHVLLFSLCLAAQLRIETESRIRALHDSLTGLPGPTLLRERFEQAYQLWRRQEWYMAVLFIDLDGFKAVNDSMGHAAGDQLLEEVASRIQEELRRADCVARIGGDEFVVLLTKIDKVGSAALVADKLLKAVAAPYWIDRAIVNVSASIGIAACPQDGEDLQTLIEAADQAMYEAKNSGKNAYAFANTTQAEKRGQRPELKVIVS